MLRVRALHPDCFISWWQYTLAPAVRIPCTTAVKSAIQPCWTSITALVPTTHNNASTMPINPRHRGMSSSCIQRLLLHPLPNRYNTNTKTRSSGLIYCCNAKSTAFTLLYDPYICTVVPSLCSINLDYLRAKQENFYFFDFLC